MRSPQSRIIAVAFCLVAISIYVTRSVGQQAHSPATHTAALQKPPLPLAQATEPVGADWKFVAPNVLSVLAFCISVYAIWATHLRPFKPMVVVANQRIRLYRIDKACDGTEVGGWWIPSIDLDLSVCNTGSRPGRFDDIRLVFDGLKKKHTFYPQWVVDFSRFNATEDRNDWMVNAVTSDWSPAMVLPKASVSYHVVCEGDSWAAVEEDAFCIYVEYYLERDHKWHRYNCFPFSIDQFTRDHLEGGGAFRLGTSNEHRSDGDAKNPA